MAKKGDATVKVGLDYSQFASAAKTVTGIARVMSGAISSAIGNIAASAFTAAARAVARFAGSIKDSVSEVYRMGERLAVMSKRTGVAAEQYQLFALAMERGITSNEAAKLLGENAKIMAQNANVFRDISLKLFGVGERIKGFWIGVAERVAPVLNPLLDRLLALDLTKWGQEFAKPIADAVSIIVQLASDGNLWKALGMGVQAAFLTGVDVLEYLGRIGGEIISAMVAGGFDSGILAAVGLWKNFVDWIGKAFETIALNIGDAFYTAMNDVLSLVYEIFDVAGEISKLLGLESAEVVDKRIAERAEDLANRRAAQGQQSLPGFGYQAGAPVGETIKKILENAGPLVLSDRSSTATEEFTSKLKDALESFYRYNSKPDTFTNKTPLSDKAFGVDSLTTVGGGGGLGNLAATIAEKQLDKLTELVNLVRGNGEEKSSYQNFYRRGFNAPSNSLKSSQLRSSQLRSATL